LPSFLSRLVANDVAKLQVAGKALYAAMLNDAGGVIDDLIIYFLTETRFRIVINAGTAEKDLAWMQAKVAEWKLDVSITQRRDGANALGIIAVQGPNARRKVWEVLPQSQTATEGLKPFFAAEVDQYFIASTGYTGEDGYEIMLPAAEAEATFGTSLAQGRRRPLWPGCPRYAAPRSRHESLWPGHGRNRIAARRRPGLDGAIEGLIAISSENPR
jgi:aminomethyltransferase